jgi:hypothetical protein
MDFSWPHLQSQSHNELPLMAQTNGCLRVLVSAVGEMMQDFPTKEHPLTKDIY